MKLRAKPINFESGGKAIVIMNKDDAEFLGLHALDRVKVKHKQKELVAIVEVTKKFAKEGEVVTNDEVTNALKLKYGEQISIIPQPEPTSVSHIKEKLAGEELSNKKLRSIVRDVVNRKLSEIELSAFLSALYIRGLSLDEAEYLSRAMVDTGKIVKVPGKIIVDKHSIGGVPGDKTSMIVVPIVAAAGLIIPKTSSRAITSPAGTADRMEVLAPVELSAEDIVRVVKKTGGCLVWGGALDLAPADDEFIKVEYPLGIDPLLLPSIISKKKAVGSEYIVIDIPTGRQAKISNTKEAENLAEDFIELGQRLGMTVVCAVTFGDEPLGYSIGPSLEAREVLETLQGKGPKDLVGKAAQVAGILFEAVGLPGKEHAIKILKSGKADKKFREIVAQQGGDPDIKPSDIPIGSKKVSVKAERSGRVLLVENKEIAMIAKEAGAPKEKAAGLCLSVKLGDKVKKGNTLFTIYSNNNLSLNSALKLANEIKPIVIGKKVEEKMLIEKIPSKIPRRRMFVLER